MTQKDQPPTPRPHDDPFLEEVHRLKREAVEGLNMAELLKKLRAIEEQHKDRLLQPPGKSSDPSAA